MGGTTRVGLGEVTVLIVDDGEWLSLTTTTGVTVKSYTGIYRFGCITRDINLLRSGQGIDL